MLPTPMTYVGISVFTARAAEATVPMLLPSQPRGSPSVTSTTATLPSSRETNSARLRALSMTVSDTSGALRPSSRASQAFWQVDDIEREVAELKARGVVFEDYDMPGGEKSASGVFTGGGAKAAWFKDSEGNIMAIIEDAGG